VNWRPLDCHAHTTFSDGELTVEEVVAVARGRGSRPSVSDHISYAVHSSLKSVDEVEAYLDELERHDVARGGELCWHDPLWRELPAGLIPRFTHLIGSLHAIMLGGQWVNAFITELPVGVAHAAWMDAHVTTLEQCVREMPVDILAHPTLVPPPLRLLPQEELWSEEHEDRVIRALLGAGVAFELSSRYRVHERFVQRAAAAGVRFSLGSDGHASAQVGEVAYGLSLARAAGVPDSELYDPAVHGSRTHART
jgi:histidinol phosphatase-like PHP family hydrolase